MALESVEFILKKLVSLNSVFPDEIAIAGYLARYLKEIGFAVKLQRVAGKRVNILAECGQGKKAVLFYGHMDTVHPVHDWGSDPFKLSAQGNKLVGLGACDMKGGLAAILKAIEKTQPQNHKLKIAFCVDEENQSGGAEILRKSNWLDDVILVISAEPGKGEKTCGGANVVTLGRRGHVTLRLEVPGFAAHGAAPERGRNAIEDAAKIISNFSNISLAEHPKLGKAGLMIRACSADSMSFTVPDKAMLIIERSTVFPETSSSVLKDLRSFIDSLYIKKIIRPVAGKKTQVFLQGGTNSRLDPYITDDSNKYVKLLKAIVKNRFGSLCVNYGLSVADDNIFATMRKIPTITLGPEGGNLHNSGEWVSRRSLRELTLVYQDFLKAL